MRRTSLAGVVWLLACSAASACTDLAPGTIQHEDALSMPYVGTETRRVVSFVARRQGRMLKSQRGIDYTLAPGAEAVAMAAGRVEWAGSLAHYGQAVVLDHGAGMRSLYANLAGITVRAGECIRRGGSLGQVGVHAMTNLPTLHVEVSDDGEFQFPLQAQP